MNRRSVSLSASIALAALALVLSAGLVAPPAAHADRVVLRDGRTLEGKVVDEGHPDRIKLIQRFGERTVERNEIKEIIKEESPEEKWEKEISAAKTPEALVKLAQKLEGEDLPRLAQKALLRAIKLSPDHAGARAALKHKKIDGKWLDEDEWKGREGWKRDPKTREWIHPEEWEKRKKAEAEKATKGYAEGLEGTGEWFEIETKSKRYKIRCNSTKAVAQRYADFLEKIAGEYDKVFDKKKYKRYSTDQSVVFIFRNNKDFQEFAEAGAGVGGYYKPFSDNPDHFPHRIVAAFHGAFGTGDTREVLAHECTHQIEHILCDGESDAKKNGYQFLMRPPWWMEGYACYFGDGFYFDKKKNLGIRIPRMRLNPIQQYLKQGMIPGQLPISKFVKFMLPQYQQMAGIAYPYGWSLIYYFHERGKVPGKRKGTFIQKPVKIKVDGKDREVDLLKVLEDFFQVITRKPPVSDINDANAMMAMNQMAEHYAKELDRLLGFPVDALTDDWKEFVLKLEAPSMGAIKGRRFTASEGEFEIEIPAAKGWRWREEDCIGDEAIRIEKVEGDKSEAVVIVEVDGNMENDPLDQIKDGAVSMAGRKFPGCTVEENEATVAGITSAYELTYEGSEQAVMPGQKIREGQQKVWHLVIGGEHMKFTYQVMCISDADKFDENKPMFEKIVNSFKLLEQK